MAGGDARGTPTGSAAGPPLHRSHLLWLGALAILSAVLLLEPLATFALFGSDTGEYFQLTNSLVTTGRLPAAGYSGWGSAYPDFPGIFLLAGAASGAVRVDVLSSLIVVIPVVAALSVAPLFLLFRRLIPQNTIALVGAGFAAVFMPRAFSIAHPAPLALGDFLVVAGLWMFVEGRRDVRFYLPLGLTAGALIVTHHLSSYFFLVSALGGLLVLELWRPGAWSRRFPTRELLFLGGFLVVLLVYWFVYAPTFLTILRTGLPFVATALIVPLLAVAGLAIGAVGLVLRWRRAVPRRRAPSFKYPSDASVARDMAIILVAAVGGALAVAFVPVPGTLDQTTVVAAVIFFLPLLATMVFCAGSRRLVSSSRLGPFGLAWLGALGLAAVLAGAAQNRDLPFARHAEYLLIPVGLLIAVGVGHLVGRWVSPRGRPAVAAAGVGVVLLMTANAALVYPPPADFGGFQEGLTYQDAGLWMWVGATSPSWTTVATDHRLSSMVFGFDGLHATWDSTSALFTGNRWADAAKELNSSQAPNPQSMRPVNLVAVDETMRSGVALDPNSLAAPMSPEASHWLTEPPFIPLYENGAEVAYWVAGPVPASP